MVMGATSTPKKQSSQAGRIFKLVMISSKLTRLNAIRRNTNGLHIVFILNAMIFPSNVVSYA